MSCLTRVMFLFVLLHKLLAIFANILIFDFRKILVRIADYASGASLSEQDAAVNHLKLDGSLGLKTNSSSHVTGDNDSSKLVDTSVHVRTP